MAERTYRIHVAAEMSGVPEATIRAWERRYGLLSPRRTQSGYRTFTELDIEILRRLRKLTEEGMSIGDAAKLVPGIRRELKAQGPVAPAVVDRTPIERWREEILASAERYDQLKVEQSLDAALATLPPLALYELLIVPLQREVGDRWHAGTLNVAQEHLVTQAVRVRLLALVHGAPRMAREHVVCACFPEEDHDVGLLGAALRFRHAGFRVTYLGARTPVVELGRVVEATHADRVALSAVNDPGKERFREVLEQVVKVVPKRCAILVGGAAAQLHPDVCAELDVRRVASEADWRTVLR